MADEPSEPTEEECGAPQNVQNEANLDLTEGSMPVEVESSKADLAAGKRSQAEAVASGQWPVAREDEVAVNPNSQIGNPKSSGPAPQNVQNEPNLESTQGSIPVEVESSEAVQAGGKRSHIAKAVARQDREADGTGILASRVEGRERHRSTTHAHSGEWMGDGEDRGDREASGPTPNGLGH